MWWRIAKVSSEGVFRYVWANEARTEFSSIGRDCGETYWTLWVLAEYKWQWRRNAFIFVSLNSLEWRGRSTITGANETVYNHYTNDRLTLSLHFQFYTVLMQIHLLEQLQESRSRSHFDNVDRDQHHLKCSNCIYSECSGPFPSKSSHDSSKLSLLSQNRASSFLLEESTISEYLSIRIYNRSHWRKDQLGVCNSDSYPESSNNPQEQNTWSNETYDNNYSTYKHTPVSCWKIRCCYTIYIDLLIRIRINEKQESASTSFSSQWIHHFRSVHLGSVWSNPKWIISSFKPGFRKLSVPLL
mgnify:CR=1 FL=1